jgi:regulatory protein YycI of two-component signal transduction system YycFG
MYADMGLAQGLLYNSDVSEDAASNVGDNVINNLRNSIKRISEIVDSDIDSQPTIRPVLDLSNVESGTARLNSMFSRTQAMQISAGMSRNHGEEIQNGVNSSTNSGNTYQFTQNNYSPKALSRAEIYRQTKNQFAAMKEVSR